MKLTLDTLQCISTGAVSVNQENGWFCFRRFSQAPEIYFPDDTINQAKATATASITLDFITDAQQLNFQYQAKRASSRNMFFFDLYVNGALVATHGRADAEEKTDGCFSYALPNGENRVTLYFPNLYNMMLKDISLADASVILPPDYTYTMICFGDSITQGYDAVHPSLTYANRLAFSLNARMINKGIGGDVFHPELIDDRNLTPDIVTVAFGTNDWAHSEYDIFTQDAASFLQKIRKFYPQAQVFVITPIWRRDSDRITLCGKFEDIAAALKTICRSFYNVHVIDGLSLAAHVPELLVDHVHPGDLGHVLYGANLNLMIMEFLRNSADATVD